MLELCQYLYFWPVFFLFRLSFQRKQWMITPTVERPSVQIHRHAYANPNQI